MLQYVAVLFRGKWVACCPGVGFCGKSTNPNSLCVFKSQEKYKLLDPQRRKSVRCEIRCLVKAVNLCPREAVKGPVGLWDFSTDRG